jgi:phosphatidylethanolamine-binding protein (PEBP) family uncharacterized protein
MRRLIAGVVLGVALLGACGGGDDKRVVTFSVTSADVKDGVQLPAAQMSAKLGAGGSDTSPQLSWSGFPDETKSFAVTMFDRDARFWHWAKANIPATTSSLAAGAPGYIGAARRAEPAPTPTSSPSTPSTSRAST